MGIWNHADSMDDRLGRCYELSGRYVMNNVDTNLVHGTIQGAGKPRISHAWVILSNGDRFDPVTEISLPKDAFDRFYNSTEDVVYGQDEVFRMLAKNRHWGPWE